MVDLRVASVCAFAAFLCFPPVLAFDSHNGDKVDGTTDAAGSYEAKSSQRDQCTLCLVRSAPHAFCEGNSPRAGRVRRQMRGLKI